jgi:hypothetical protein
MAVWSLTWRQLAFDRLSWTVPEESHKVAAMQTRSLKRRFLAVAAAYAVALQVMLLPLSVAASSPFSTALCSASAKSQQTPSKTDTGCACASGCGMQCCTPGFLSPPSSGVDLAPRQAVILAPAVFFNTTAPHHRRGPQNPRAPPLA